MNNLRLSKQFHIRHNQKGIYNRAIEKEEKLLAEYFDLLRPANDNEEKEEVA